MVDALGSAPNQDIIRPFDNFTARVSESKSISNRKKRTSLVGNAPPTVDSLEASFTPFGESFKTFTQEPPLKPWVSADGATPSLTSTGTTLDTNPEEATVTSATPRSVASPTPSKTPSTSYFKRFKSRMNAYLQPGSSEKATEQIAAKQVTSSSTPKVNEKTTPRIVVEGSMDNYKEKNSSSPSMNIGSIRRLGRRSKDSRSSISDNEKDKASSKVSEEDPKTSSEPPASPGGRAGDDQSQRYAHGVLLHPIVEEDK